MTKLSTKAFSLLVAGLVTVTSVGPVDFAYADTTKDATYKVHFLPDATWTKNGNTPNIYSYYVANDAEKTENGDAIATKPNGEWPGSAMTAEAGHEGWYDATVKVENSSETSAHVIFLTDLGEDKKTPALRYPADLKPGLDISAETWFYVDGEEIKSTTTAPSTYGASATTAPTATVAATAGATSTPEPTATPEPVSNGAFTVDKASGTSFYEEDSDTLPVEISLAEGVKSATYSIDNGPETEITGTTTVYVGEGKIANSTVTLTVKADNGTTAEFKYEKKTKVTETKTVSTTMVKLFDLVASSSETTYTAYFKLPTAWGTETPNIYSYYVLNDKDKNENGMGTKVEPNKAWPGSAMTPVSGADGWYKATVSVSADSVDPAANSANVIFLNGAKENGTTYETAMPVVGGTPKPTTMPNYDVANRYPEEGKEAPTITADTWFTMDSTGKVVGTTTAPSDFKAEATTAPTTEPTSTPEATTAPDEDIKAYFGASLSAPQYNTTALSISAVATNVSNATYTFTVDNEEIYSGSSDVTDWNASKLAAGTHTIAVTITSGDKTTTLTKNYTLVAETTDVASGSATVVPTASAISTPKATATPAATVEPTAAPVQGTISFNKTGKTVGETIKISYNLPSSTSDYTYTYTATKGSETTLISDSTNKTTVNWKPTVAGKYTIEVTAFDAKGNTVSVNTATYTVGKRTLTFKSFKLSKTTVKKGAKIKFTAKATTTTGKVKYKFVIKNTKTGKTVKTRKSSTSASFTWKASAKGSYKVVLTYTNGKVSATSTKKFKVK